MELRDLSDRELARLLLRKLYQHYDRGGISMGRAPRAVILETALRLIPLPVITDMDQWGDEALMAEADRRPADRIQLQLFLFTPREISVRSLPSELLGRLLIHKLLAWYRYDKIGRLYFYDWQLVTAATKLLPLPWKYPSLRLQEVEGMIQEVKERLFDWQSLWHYKATCLPS